MSETTFPITPEGFETWLRRVATRTPGRMFDYGDNFGCLLCAPANELTGAKWCMGSATYHGIEPIVSISNMPTWAVDTGLWYMKLQRDNGRLPVAASAIWASYAAWKGLDPALEPVDITAHMSDIAGVPEPEEVR